MHEHTDECWEPDSGCDIGRNEAHVAVGKPFASDLIVAAAIRKGDQVWAMPQPFRHHDIIEYMVDCVGLEAPIGPGGGYEQGFVGQSGEFLTREQAAAVVGKPGKLHSEDLW